MSGEAHCLLLKWILAGGYWMSLWFFELDFRWFVQRPAMPELDFQRGSEVGSFGFFGLWILQSFQRIGSGSFWISDFLDFGFLGLELVLLRTLDSTGFFQRIWSGFSGTWILMLGFSGSGLGYFKDFGCLVFRIPDDVKVYPQSNVYKSISARFIFISIYCIFRKRIILHIVLTASDTRKHTNVALNCYLPVNCGLKSGAFFNFRATGSHRIW
jgi:hypothetical protein